MARSFVMRLEEGCSVKEIAEELAVSEPTLYRWFRRGTIPNDSKRPWQQKLTDAQGDMLKEYYATCVGASLEDGVHMVRNRFKTKISLSTARKYRDCSSNKVAGLKAIFKTIFDKYPTATPRVIAERLKEEHDLQVAVETVLRYSDKVL